MSNIQPTRSAEVNCVICKPITKAFAASYKILVAWINKDLVKRGNFAITWQVTSNLIVLVASQVATGTRL